MSDAGEAAAMYARECANLREELAHAQQLVEGCSSRNATDADTIAELKQQLSDALGEPTEWISVEGRLPEDGERVLIPALFGEVENVRFIHGKWHDSTGYVRKNMCGDDLPPEHWMPLPEPPQAAQESD